MPRASGYETWPVRGKLQGENGKKSKSVSGIACATTEGFPRACLVIDDNLQEAQFVTVKDGEIVAGGMISLIDNSFEGEHLELDGEGVAYADGFFYVIGSHGHPRDSDHSLDPDKDAARIAAHKLRAVRSCGSARMVLASVDGSSGQQSFAHSSPSSPTLGTIKIRDLKIMA
jgi:hypothetical protein